MRWWSGSCRASCDSLVEDDGLDLTEAGTERKAGVWVIEGDPLSQEPLDHLGPDADAVDRAAFTEALVARNQRIHGFLRDQLRMPADERRVAARIFNGARDSAIPAEEFARQLPAKIAQLDIDSADLRQVIDVFGQPEDYVWGNETYEPDDIDPIHRIILLRAGYSVEWGGSGPSTPTGPGTTPPGR